MNKLKIYNVTDKYIDFLRQYDIRIPYNKKGRRPYIGVVLQIKEFNYFAPLSSPKPKHLIMKNKADFIKIKSGELGIINLNNMIPVPKEEIILYNIMDEEDTRYQNLLIKQVFSINKMINTILNKATKLHDNVVRDTNFLDGRCCNFKLLEEKYIEYCRSKF
ncbi:type III toxin-antitoxin system ToxN/AbiQ family toxin [Sinanaerobacter sp. ZZT-01]|uniref:type III toxin-antitoxin system ToxN/AbiQ family toxin n=1 Tax=Sinanaerobacter sp. ZZT-01 TaxID=3111540 RepID=UPI002D7694E9|nr:type III toxin-antitoxin system ToxN/AbiQ family toxin [Sinanaerobacter sp. ZZT-01]WRR94214.1 type III toxin-antitoxin system ToxN/AbiQ family toxin [Sinanaerobacter sp. ZZT-01]